MYLRTHLIALFLIIAFATAAQVIPSTRRVDWTQVGLESKMDTPSIVRNVMDFGTAADGMTDDFSAIDSAIQSLNGSPGIVYFPAGTYAIESPLSLPDSTILSGLSSDSTILLFDFPSSGTDCIRIGGSSGGSFVSLSSGYTRGSDVVTVSSSSGITAGDWIEIRQDNGAWDVKPVSGVDYCVGQVVKVAAVNGNQITLEQPLRINYSASLNPQVRKLNPAQQIGVQNLKVERKNDPTTGAGKNFSFSYAVNCWLSGVESRKSIGAHVLAKTSSHLSITGSYFHEAFTYDGSGTRGYGVCLIQHTGDVLIENNIFRKLRHSMMVKQGANGNVFGYNYSLVPNRTEIQSDYGGDISAHGHFPFANLFEGNIVQNIHIDYTWGPSGPLNTFFRNRAELFGIWMTAGSYPSDSQNFVGNEVTHREQCLYFCLMKMGNYSLSGNHNFEYGNNVKQNTTAGVIIPSNTSVLNDQSYYLGGVPIFWDISDSFPSIGPGNLLNGSTNPAKYRYDNSSEMTVGKDPLPVELTSFCVLPYDSGVSIFWSTASEINNDFFKVERSADLHNIMTLKRVNGAGNSALSHSYQVMDRAPLNDFSYYRLKQVDFNGQVHYHPWVPVQIKGTVAPKVKVYPQPVAGQQVTLEFPSQLALPMVVYFTDSSGKQLIRRKVDSQYVVMKIPGNWPAGVYQLTTVDAQQWTLHQAISIQ